MEKNPQIICFVGGPSSGKSQVATKLHQDHKYHHICIQDAISKGILKDGEELVDSLIAHLHQHKPERLLLEGFPRTAEEGVRFEAKYHSIDRMVKFDCGEDTLVKRTLSRKDNKHTEEAAREAITGSSEKINSVVEYYERFGVVRRVHCDKQSDDVYNLVKKAMLPQIIFLYGAPKTGKTSVGKILAEKIGYGFVSLEEFYKEHGGTDKFANLNTLIQYLRFDSKRFFVVDDLLENREQYNIFVSELGEPYKLFSFEAQKDEVEQKIRKHTHQHAHKKQFERYQQYITNKEGIGHATKDKPFLCKINATQSIDDIVRQIINKLKPVTLASYYTNPPQQKYIYELESSKGWKVLNVEQLILGHISRKTKIGKKIQANGGRPTSDQFAMAMIHSLFRGTFSKVILAQIGDQLQKYLAFQKHLYPLILLDVEFTPRTEFYPQSHPILYYLSVGRLIQIKQNRLDLVDAKLNKSVNYGIVFGAAVSGKSTISKAVAKNCDFVLVQWQPTMTTIKQKYLSEEEKGLEEVPFGKVIKYFKELFEKNSKKTFIFDGFVPEKNFDNFVKEVGVPGFFVNLRVQKPVLIKRTRGREGGDVNAQVTEEDNQKYDAILEKGNNYVKLADGMAESNAKTKSYQVDANASLDKTLKNIDSIFTKKVYVVYQDKEQENEGVSKKTRTLWKNICHKQDVTFIDVPDLFQREYRNPASQFSSELQNQTKMVGHKEGLNTRTCSPAVVVQIIQNYLYQTGQNSSEILLFGYPTPHDSGVVYPRASDQLAAIENGLGPVRIVCAIETQMEQLEHNDPRLEVKKPAEPQKKVKEGEQPPAEDKPPGDAPDKKAQFNLADYQWTDSNGRPKSLYRWYCHLKPSISQVLIDITQQNLAANSKDEAIKQMFHSTCKTVRQQPSNIYIHLQKQS